MSRHFEPSSMAREELGIEEQVLNEMRARQAGVYVVATRSIRRDCWRVAITGHGKATQLYGHGPLSAVIDGAYDDFEAADDYTAEELLAIRRQSIEDQPDDDPLPADINREGLPEFNGAFR